MKDLPRAVMQPPERMTLGEIAACEKFAAKMGIAPLFSIGPNHHGQHSWCCSECNSFRVESKTKKSQIKQPWEIEPEPVERVVVEPSSTMQSLLSRSKDSGPFVYFIQAVHMPASPVKIGVAQMVWRRLKELQTGYPYELRVLVEIPGGYKLERALHATFADCRAYGEWFAGPGVPTIIGIALKLANEAKIAHANGRMFDPPDHDALVNMAADVRREIAAHRVAA